MAINKNEGLEDLKKNGWVPFSKQKYEIKDDAGNTVGTIGYKAAKALNNNKLFDYDPQNDEERKVFSYLRQRHNRESRKREQREYYASIPYRKIDDISKSTDLSKSEKEKQIDETVEKYSRSGQKRENLKKYAEEKKPDSFVSWLGKNAMNGLSQFNKQAISTLDYILPTEFLGKYDFISKANDYYKKESERYADEAQKSSVSRGKGWTTGGELVSGTVNALPNAIMAFMSAGASLGASAAPTLTNTAAASSSILSKIGQSAKEMVQNPSYWTSVLQTLGTDYEDAKERGADDFTAATTAILTTALNAGIEVGGGTEVLPKKLKEGSKNAVLDWVKSSLEEGGEEVVQGITTNAMAKLMYDRNAPIFSTTDENAVVNPVSLSKEFGMGAAVGGILGGGQIGAAQGINKGINYADNQTIGKRALSVSQPDVLINRAIDAGLESSDEKTVGRIQKLADKYKNGNASAAEVGEIIKTGLRTGYEQEQNLKVTEDTQTNDDVALPTQDTARQSVLAAANSGNSESSVISPSVTAAANVSERQMHDVKENLSEGGAAQSVEQVQNAVKKVTNTMINEFKNSNIKNIPNYQAAYDENLRLSTTKGATIDKDFIKTYANQYAEGLKRNNSKAYKELASVSDDVGSMLTDYLISNRIPQGIGDISALAQAGGELRSIVGKAVQTTLAMNGKIYNDTDRVSAISNEISNGNFAVVYGANDGNIALAKVGEYYEAYGADAVALAKAFGVSTHYIQKNGRKTLVADVPSKYIGEYAAKSGYSGTQYSAGGNEYIYLTKDAERGNLSADAVRSDITAESDSDFIAEIEKNGMIELDERPSESKIETIAAQVERDNTIPVYLDGVDKLGEVLLVYANEEDVTRNMVKTDINSYYDGVMPERGIPLSENTDRHYDEDTIEISERPSEYDADSYALVVELDRTIPILLNGVDELGEVELNYSNEENVTRDMVKSDIDAYYSGTMPEHGVSLSNNYDPDIKFSVESVGGTDKKYVKADRQVISGDNPEEWRKQVYNYINSSIRKGKDINVLSADGDVLTITEDTAGKARFRNTIREPNGNLRKMTNEEFAVKLRAESHIDEIAEVSKKNGYSAIDTKNHHFAKDGFYYRTAYFEDFDGKYYKLTLSVGKSGEINTVYNVGKLKETYGRARDSKVVEQKPNNARRGFSDEAVPFKTASETNIGLRGGTPSDNTNISQNDDIVNSIVRNNSGNDTDIKFSVDGDGYSKQLVTDFETAAKDIMTISDYSARVNAEARTAVRILENTPNVILDNIEGSADLPIVINFTKMYLAARKSGVIKGNYHNLGSDILMKLPQMISDPDMILQLGNGRLNLLSETKTENGNNAVVSIELNSTKDIEGKNKNYNVVVTLFSANDNYVRNLINKDGTEIKYTKEDLSQVNPRLYNRPATFNDKSSIDNISQNNDVVNSNIRENSGNDTDIKFSVDGEGYSHVYSVEKADKGYLNYSNTDIESAIENIRNGNTDEIPSEIEVALLNPKTAEKISDVVGFDISDYKCKIEKDTLLHIEKRHGLNGKQDQSLADPKDVARMGYVINNADTVSFLKDGNGDRIVSKKYNDRNNTPCPILMISKRIDGTYCVSQVVPDSKKKTVWVTSVRIQKADVGSQVPNTVKGQQLTSETPLVSSSALDNTNISQNDNIVNSNIRKNSGNDTDIKFSVDEDFAAKYDRWVENGGNYRQTLNVGRTSETLKSIGVPDKKITWDTAKIAKIKEKHNVDDNIIKQVPYILEEPIVIMKSLQKSSRITLCGEVYDLNNKPVMAILELNPTNAKGDILLDEIKLVSAYGKDNLQNLINKSEILYVEPNKKRTNDWLTQNRLQLPLGQTNHRYNTNISQNDDIVNSNIRENSENDTENVKFSQDISLDGGGNIRYNDDIDIPYRESKQLREYIMSENNRNGSRLKPFGYKEIGDNFYFWRNNSKTDYDVIAQVEIDGNEDVIDLIRKGFENGETHGIDDGTKRLAEIVAGVRDRRRGNSGNNAVDTAELSNGNDDRLYSRQSSDDDGIKFDRESNRNQQNTEVGNYGRDDILNGNDRRTLGESERERGSGVQEITGDASGNASEEQSSASTRGIYARDVKEAGGVERRNDRGVEADFVKSEYYNDEMRRIAAENDERGVVTHFILGNGRAIEYGTNFRGAVRGNEVYIQADHGKYSPTQINRHEIIHRNYSSDTVQTLKNRIKSRLTNEQIQDIAESLYRDYAQKRRSFDEIFEEFVCDVMADMNDYAEMFETEVRNYWATEEQDRKGYSPSTYTESIDAGGKNTEVKRFIDELSNNADKFNQEEKVFDVEYKTIPKKGKTSEAIANYFKSIGGIAVNPHLGVVELNKKGAKTTVFHGISGDKFSAVAAIKDVIENGKIIAHDFNWKNRGYDTYLIAGRGYINGQDAVVGVIVKNYPKSNQNNKFYLHEIIKIGASHTAVDNNTIRVNEQTPINNTNISQNDNDVNSIVRKSSKNDTQNPDIRFSTDENTDVNVSTDEDMSYLSEPVRNIRNDINEVINRADLKKGGKVYDRAAAVRVRDSILDNISIGDIQGIDMRTKKDRAVMTVLVNRALNSAGVDAKRKSARDLTRYIAQNASVYDADSLCADGGVDYEGDRAVILNYIKHGVKISPDAKEAIISAVGENSARGYIAMMSNNGALGIDSVYDELSVALPGYFTSDALTEGEKMRRVIDVYTWLKDGKSMQDVKLIDVMTPDDARAFTELVQKQLELAFDTMGRDSAISREIAAERAKYEQRLSDIREKYEAKIADMRNSAKKKQSDGAKAKNISTEQTGNRFKNLAEAAKKYGAIKKGANAVRDIEMPKRIDDNRYVSRFARTMAEAGVTPDESLSEFERNILDGKMTYERITDEEAKKSAADKIMRRGFMQALDDWNEMILLNQRIGKNEMALGQTLYNQCINAKDAQNAMKIAADLANIATQAGQTVQACMLIKQMSPDCQLYSLEQSVEKMKREFENKRKFVSGEKRKIDLKINEELAQKLLNAKTDDERRAVMDEILQDIANQIPSTLKDKWDSWRYLSMLGNPRTHIRNIGGNAVFMLPVKVKNAVGWVLEKTISKDKRTKSLKSTKDSKNFAAADYAKMKDIIQGSSGKYEELSKINELRRIYKFKPLEWLRKANFAALEWEDGIFLKHHYVNAMAQFLTARGYTSEFMNSGTKDAASVLENARAYAMSEAQKATYRDANAIAETLSRWQRNLQNNDKLGVRVVGQAVEGIVPFKKTPLNIAKRGVEYSPIGLISGLYDAAANIKSGKVTAAQAIDKIASGLTGTGLVILGMGLSKLGLVRGDDDDDDKLARLDSATGEQSYSFKIGNHSYTIDWVAPASMPFFMGVSMWNAFEKTDKFTFEEILNAVLKIPAPLLNLSVLSSLSDLIRAGDYSSTPTEKMADYAWQATTSYVGQAFPTVMGQITRTVDKTKRNASFTDPDNGLPAGLDRFIARQATKIPGLSKILEPKIDMWGREETYGDTWYGRLIGNTISPGYYKEINSTALDDELRRLGNEYEGDGSVLPPKNQKSFTYEKQKYYMTPSEYAQYSVIRGQKSFEYADELIRTDDYKNKSAEEKKKALEKCYDAAGDEAKNEILKGRGIDVAAKEAEKAAKKKSKKKTSKKKKK